LCRKIIRDCATIREFAFRLRVTIERRVVVAAIRPHVMGKWIKATDQRTVRMYLTALGAQKYAAAILFLL